MSETNSPQFNYDFNRLKSRFETMQRAVSGAMAQRDMLQAQDAELVRRVSLAKARVETKEDVNAMLEKIQQAEYQQTIGSYSSLLTALVHDVVGDDIEILVDMYTKNGAPAIKIYEHAAGEPEFKKAVYKNSGALMNTVSAGLRMIATAKSGGRRFLMLDEADCWLPPARVPMFYNVLLKMCKEFDFQIVVISHHPPELLGPCRVVRLQPGPEEVVEETHNEDAGKRRSKKNLAQPKKNRTALVKNVSGGVSWNELDEERPGVRKLRGVNFATMKDLTIELDPYLTAICGDSYVGKSRIPQLFRTMFYGEIDGDEHLRHGQSSYQIEVELEHGKTVEFSRDSSRNPVNKWVMRQGDKTLEYNGQICSTGGVNTPDWLEPMTGIINNDMALQISGQVSSVFLLDLENTAQARALAVGQEVQWLHEMQGTYKDHVREWNKSIKSGEESINSLRQRIAALDGLDEAQNKLNAMKPHIDAMEASIAKSQNMVDFANEVGALSARYEKGRKLVDTLNRLPQPIALRDAATLSDASISLAQTSGEISRLTRATKTLAGLPKTPVLSEVSGFIEASVKIRDNTKQITEYKAVVKALDKLPKQPLVMADTSALVVANEISASIKEQADLTAKITVLRKLPAMPSIDKNRIKCDEIIALSSDIANLDTRNAKGYQAINDAERELQDLHEQRHEIIKQIGDDCPLCMTPFAEAGPNRKLHADSPNHNGYAP